MSEPLKIVIDPDKLTMGDWETIEGFQAGVMRIGATMQIIARCSDWTMDQLRALPASAVQEVIGAVSEALAQKVNPKN